MHPNEPTKAVQMLRLGDVMRLTGLGRSTIYAAIKTRAFPAPVRISTRAVAWRETELAKWQASRETTSEAADAGA